MKFCALICEYNPFHNGHLYQLDKIRELSGCDKILCIMSGNFTQRGEAAVYHKSIRARHAVRGGADAVIELPALFSVAAAETFAKGAVRILREIPSVEVLAFGCESGDRESFMKIARLEEDKNFKAALKENMKNGTSYARAYAQTAREIGEADEEMLAGPNNILGFEYCRAIVGSNAKIEPLPIPRVGGGYADTELKKNFSSATALRLALLNGNKKAQKLARRNMPDFVKETALRPALFEQMTLAAVAVNPAEEIALCPDCSEGLENRLKAMTRSNPVYAEMLGKVVSKRYTLSRVKRLLLQNLLRFTRKDVKDALENPLYAKVLAVKKDGSEELLKELDKSRIPIVVRKSDALALKKEALACFGADVRANDLFNVLNGLQTNEFETVFVD